MNFFLKLYKFVVSSGYFSRNSYLLPEISPAWKNSLFFTIRELFPLIFVASVLLHIVLVIITMAFSELWEQELPPITSENRGPFFTTSSRANAPIEKPKPVLKKIENEWQPKLSNLVPKKPLLEKPVLEDTLINQHYPKPEVTQPEAPRLKMSEPQLAPSVPTTKLNKIPAPQVTKNLKKPQLLPTNSLRKNLH